MKPKKQAFYTCYTNEHEFEPTYTIAICSCEDDDPPSKLTKSVQKFCGIVCNLGISYNSLEDYIALNGRSLKKFRYDMLMVPSGASNEFSLWYQGRKLGSKDAPVEFQ